MVCGVRGETAIDALWDSSGYEESDHPIRAAERLVRERSAAIFIDAESDGGCRSRMVGMSYRKTVIFAAEQPDKLSYR